MQLPDILSNLLAAQAAFDSNAYANCFSTTAVVHDEGRTYNGRQAIKAWNEATNTQYKTMLTPVEYTANGNKGILKASVSGTFDGSPVILTFSFGLQHDQIESLEIKG